MRHAARISGAAAGSIGHEKGLACWRAGFHGWKNFRFPFFITTGHVVSTCGCDRGWGVGTGEISEESISREADEPCCSASPWALERTIETNSANGVHSGPVREWRTYEDNQTTMNNQASCLPHRTAREPYSMIHRQLVRPQHAHGKRDREIWANSSSPRRGRAGEGPAQIARHLRVGMKQ